MANDDRPRVSVIICTRNEEAHIGRCLDSLLANTYPPGRVEIVVCDGRSTDATRDVVAEYANRHTSVKLIDNPGRTAPKGFNLGIARARGEIIAILGAHSEVAPDWIERNVDALEEHPDAAGVGGRMTTVGQGYAAGAIARALSSPFGVGNSSFRVGTQARYTDTVVFGAYRRETFERYGTFDEELARNQDDELNYRIRSQGGRLWFDPAIRSTYCARQSFRHLHRQFAQYGFWKPLVYRKCPGVFAWRQLAPPAFVASLACGVILGLLWSPGWLVLGGILCAYMIATGASAIWLAARSGLRYLPALPPVFAIVHVAYGLHFLHGVAYFLVLRRSPGSRHARLTR